ncbi:MAG: gliding motility protein GldL [Bacteroidales bacterium]|nr:gliding motility protein GldL [Bacteroidales bacterium]
MEESVKTQFDFINFVYGVGAAVILIAAMFKFLGWTYANEIFIVGLTTEAIVFLVSAFQWKIERKGYRWEKIFPALSSESETIDEKIDLSESIQQYYKNTDSIIRTVQSLDKAIQNFSKVSEELADSVKKISKSVSKIEDSSENYETELNSLKARMNHVNEFYSEMAKLVENK